MKKKTPKTIADLDINWTFCEDNGVLPNKTKQYKLFQELNPQISKLVIRSDQYEFCFNNKTFHAGSYNSESLAEYIVYVNYCFWSEFKKPIKLSRFERISDTEYIIHGK